MTKTKATTKTTTCKRPNRGAQLLRTKSDSKREVAERVGVSASLAGYWRTGERKPNVEAREKLRDFYGIPVDAWDEPEQPERRSTRAAAPATSVATSVADTSEVADEDTWNTTADAASDDETATLARNAERLNRMIRRDLARLESDNTLEPGKRAEILKKLSDAQVALARASGESAITMQRIAAHPEFRRCVQRIVDALAPYPEALAAVAKAFP